MMTIPNLQPHTSTAISPGGILAFAVEEKLLRACLLDLVDADYRLVGWVTVQRSLHAPLTGQLATVVRRLGQRLGRRLWDAERDAPFLRTEDPVREPPLGQIVGAIAPSEPLRVWCAALSRHVSVAAVNRALAATATELVGVTTMDGRLDSGQLATAMLAAAPDVLVIAGGYDSLEATAQTALLDLCTMASRALVRFPPSQRPLVVYAGSRWLAEAATQILQGAGDGVRVEVVRNVQPVPGLEDQTDLVRALHQQHWRLACRVPGIAKAGQWVNPPAQLTSLDWSFSRLVQLWCEVNDLAELHGAYQAERWRLHVWARRGMPELHMAYMLPGRTVGLPVGWPPLQLMSGEFVGTVVPPASLRWWNRSGLAPLVATVGQLDPTAMLQTLRHDILPEVVTQPTTQPPQAN